MTDRTYSPAETYGHPLAQLNRALKAHNAERTSRRFLRKLLRRDDALLRDVGVTRGEVETALSLPMSQDAATQLHRLSLQRTRTHR